MISLKFDTDPVISNYFLFSLRVRDSGVYCIKLERISFQIIKRKVQFNIELNWFDDQFKCSWFLISNSWLTMTEFSHSGKALKCEICEC